MLSIRRALPRVLLLAAGIGLVPAGSARTQTGQGGEVPREWRPVQEAFGRKGELKAEEKVYTTSFPRADLSVQIGGQAVPTALGFSSWVAFKKGPHGAMAMSDMVLLPDEVNSVISSLQAGGIEVTALHRHFQREQPQIMYLHSEAAGDPGKIAAAYRTALAGTGTPMGPEKPSEAKGPDIDTVAIARIVGQEGQARGGVYKITVGRDDLTVRAMGVEVTKSMGLNSWAAFIGTDAQAHVAGDIAMRAEELNPVIHALHANGIEIVSVHNHMLQEEPRVFFLHYWGTGPAQQLARGFRAALEELGRS